MKVFLAIIDGKKTYLSSGGIILFAFLGLYFKFLTPQEAMDHFFAALGMIGFRSALNKLNTVPTIVNNHIDLNQPSAPAPEIPTPTVPLT